MPKEFTFTGYVIAASDNKRIYVRVDNKYLDTVEAVLSDASRRSIHKDTVAVNITKCVYTIESIQWNELTDLIGVHVSIVAHLREYNFSKRRSYQSPNNNMLRRYVDVHYAGYTIIASRLKNIID